MSSDGTDSVDLTIDMEEFIREKSSRPKTTDDEITIADMGNETPIDAEMFPKERDKERERARRAKYAEEKKQRDLLETQQKMDWIKKHTVDINLEISILFEVQRDAPYYNLFSYIPRISEPFSRILVDGNLLMPFVEGLSSSEYFAYVGGRLFNPNEEVIRIIQKRPLPILSDQLWNLRSMKNEYGKPIEFTTPTEIQKLNGRSVFFNVPTPKDEPPTCPGKDKCMCEKDSRTDWEAYKTL